jgi:hypothetical protein
MTDPEDCINNNWTKTGVLPKPASKRRDERWSILKRPRHTPAARTRRSQMTDRNDRIFRNAGAIADHAERAGRNGQALQLAAGTAAMVTALVAWRVRLLGEVRRAGSRLSTYGEKQPKC